MAPSRASTSVNGGKAINKSQSGTPAVLGAARIAKPALKKQSSKKGKAADDLYGGGNNLVDSLRPRLVLVMIGLNPGLETARTGHAYAHRSNRFWPLLHDSGITPIRHLPCETRDLMDLYSVGNTNIASRPTRDGSTLTKEELAEGARILETKIRAFRPEAVAVVGKSIWESLWLARTGKKIKKDQFKYGWQDDEARVGRLGALYGKVEWEGARTYVTTTTSGLAATMSPAEKLAIWKPLGEWFTQRRQELEELKNEET